MRLLELTLQNLGPFDEAHLQFMPSAVEPPPVVLITGENGTGKSIILDAIRGVFGPHYANLERTIWRPNLKFKVELLTSAEGREIKLGNPSGGLNMGGFVSDSALTFWNLPVQITGGGNAPNWVVDFWRSTLATDRYEIFQLVNQNHSIYLQGSLQGTYRNAAVTELICYFDYLRDSQDPRERTAGEMLFETTKKIVRASLLEGELSHVARSTFTPMIKQGGQLVTLASLSSGNAYLIQHLISMLGKMYAVHVLRQTDPADLCNTPGLLLIDEAENHLHPRWQKRFIPDVLGIFPNLQIIATTHSPFIISSVPNARVFVCRLEGQHCTVTEESDVYANKPVEEILLSGVFNGTQPFNAEISRLMEERKRAVESGDEAERRRIENMLKEKNPDYFSYLDVEDRLRAIGAKKP